MFSRSIVRILRIVIVVTILLNVGLLLATNFRGNRGIAVLKQAYEHYASDRNGQPWMNIKAEDLHQYGFNNKLRKRFERVRNNKDDRYWLAHTELTEIETYVAIKPFLKNSEYSVEDENSWVNKNELFYDPRFTLSIYLNAIKHKYTQASIAQGGSLKEKPDLNELTRIELPFNWVDWLDLTSLNEELAKPMDQRIDCPYIRGGTNNDPDPEYFCWDNIRYSDDMVRDLGFRNRNQLPRFIIHGHSTHDDRPFNDFRVMEAKCYALSQHLPKPVKVVILNGEGGTYEFDVKQNTNEKMITSDLIDYFIDTNMYDRKDLKPDSLVTINHIKEFDDLKAKVIPRTLSESEDLVGMYNILRKTSNPSASRELKLTEEMFHYNKDSMNKQIEELEAKGASQLTINEEMYLQSIKYCAEFPNSDDEETYFKMATIRIDDDRNRDKEWGWHYDWRFFNGALNYDRIGWNEQEMNYRSNIILDRLLRNWNRFAEEKGLISWIMHGPLLSWFWDGLMFPFDLDIDIQMPMSELVRLARDFNQTLIVEDPAEGYGKYFIDVGSFIHNRDISSKSNHIDARVVDVDSGIYIDVTALAKSKANAPEEYDSNVLVDIAKPQDDDQVEIYNDRRKHFYKLDQLSPLRYTMMGGVPVFIPSTITNRLVFEYSEGLTNLEFHDWYFVHGLNLWLKNDIVGSIFADEEVKNPEGEYDREKMLRRIAKMDDSDIFNLLDTYDEVLMEYYLTKDLTDYHDMEKQYLFDSYGRDNKKLDLDPHMKDEYNQFVSTFKMSKPLRKSLWDYENIERIKHHNS